MQAVKISEKVYWVGAIDWNIRDFHGYSTKQGTTYNAFLILSKKTTLIDTVKKEFFPEMMARIASVIDPKKIEIIISNHAELDHAGALPQTVCTVQPKEIYASDMGVKNILAQLHPSFEVKPVKTGDKIDLGDDTLSFIEARMLHWPDSMFSYLEKEKVLFTNDVFGMHLATSQLFDDENDEHIWLPEAEKYYANIILPYSDIALRFLDNFKQMNLTPKIIAPDHGFIWRKDLSRIVNLYEKWAAQKPQKKVVVVYDTMWGSTQKMAEYVTEGLRQGGMEVKQMSMHSCHRSEVAHELLNAGGLVVGTPVINSEIFPAMADVLCYLKGLKKKHLVGGAIGSYGWNPAPVNGLAEWLKAAQVELAAPVVSAKFSPTPEILEACRQLGFGIAQKITEKVGK